LVKENHRSCYEPAVCLKFGDYALGAWFILEFIFAPGCFESKYVTIYLAIE
jgi:hypothetical protein